MVIPIHILGLVNKFIVRYELTDELYIVCTESSIVKCAKWTFKL